MKKIYLLSIIAVFSLYSCGGEGNEKKPASETAAPVVSGEEIYHKTCAACHQATGEGIAGAFPPLAKSDYLVNHENTIMQVLKGSSGEMVVNGQKYNNVMPPQPLNDEECAAVLTYVYCHLGNNECTITPDEVKAVRAKL
jgi:nitrite reductase (NO-forming)